MRIQRTIRDLVHGVNINRNTNASGFFRTFRGAVTLSESTKVATQICQHIIKINN